MYKFIALDILLRTLCVEADYFDSDFDESKNCEHEELMEQLWVDPLRCSHVSRGSDAVQWEECKSILSNNLVESCPNTKIERVSRHQSKYSLNNFIKDWNISLL